MAALAPDCPLCSAPAVPRNTMVVQLQVTEVVPGAWCELCLLPSVLTAHYRLACEHGWPAGTTGVRSWCDDCGVVLRTS